ncbi:MAG TPA: DUF3426 domain-containing protein [Steroidobacteraceae bacterium]
MFTQCSQCETVFRLSAEVLRAAGGQVRCGKCGEVFNALAHLAEDASAFTVGETEIDLEFRAASILESPSPVTPPRNPPPADDFEAPGPEIARLQIIDWNGDELSEPNAEDVEETESEQFGETSLEFTLPPGELDRIFVETKKKGALSALAPEVEIEFAPRAQPPAQSPAQSLAQPQAQPAPPHPEDIEIFIAAAIAAEAAPEATSSAEVPRGFEVPEDVRREMLSVLESPHDIELPDDIEPPARVRRPTRSRRRPRESPFDLAPPESNRTFIPWLIAAIAAALLLVAQVVHQNREWLAAHAPLGGTLRALYSTMGAPVAPPANLSAYQLRQWGVTGDPAADGTLRVRASILNTAAQLEPYPLLRVTLANRFGGGIGTRDFEPSEYLGKPTAKLLAPGERADAIMDILDPGKSAEGFEIDVCLRGADRKISCANDAAPAQAKR